MNTDDRISAMQSALDQRWMKLDELLEEIQSIALHFPGSIKCSEGDRNADIVKYVLFSVVAELYHRSSMRTLEGLQ